MANFVRASSLWLAALVVLLLSQHSSLAQEVRFALVIGNDQYRTATLATPANDAGLVADALGAAGFAVTGARNLDQAALRETFREFIGQVASAGPNAVAVIYLAGFGLQFGGENYFVPIDADIQRDVDVPLQAIRVSDFNQPLAALPGRVKITLSRSWSTRGLHGCRDTPPRRGHRRRDPARARPAVPAPAVRRHPHDHQPVQQLRDVIAQPRERHPALRAAVPATGKVPDHLEPGQMRVIPPPRPRPRAPLVPAPARAVLPLPAAARAIVTGGRLRARALRGAPEQHPLQNRQVSPEILQLGRLPRVLRPQPGVLLPKPGILLAQLSGQQRHLPIRFQRRSQHIPERCLSTLQDRDNPRRDRHPAQQTPSTTVNHAPRTTCPDPADTIAELLHHATSEYLRLSPLTTGQRKACGGRR